MGGKGNTRPLGHLLSLFGPEIFQLQGLHLQQLLEIVALSGRYRLLPDSEYCG